MALQSKWLQSKLGKQKLSGLERGSWDKSYKPAIDMIYGGRGVGASLFSHAASVESAARTEWIARSQGVIVGAGREVMIDGSVLNESSLGAGICSDKALTKVFLLAAGVRTPQGQVVSSVQEALAVAEELAGPVVVKPVGGSTGRGVTVGVSNEADICQAYDHAAGPERRRVLVEQCIDVESEYRCMASMSQCVSVIERILPYVVGDGEETVRGLVQRKNNERKRNPAIHNLPIPLDHVVDRVLDRQGLYLDSVPAQGQRVLVRNVGGLSGGGEPIDRFDDVPLEVKKLASDAVLAVPDLSWGGVDVAVERNTGLPFIIEINARAGYGAATFPVQGISRDVASFAWHARMVMTRADPPKSNVVLQPTREPHAVAAFLPSRQAPRKSSTFARFFFAWLSSQGYELDKTHAGAVRVRGFGIDKWFLRNSASGLDRLATHRVVRRHHLVRRLLDRKNVYRVKGRLLDNASAVERLFPETRRVIATPRSHPWGSPDAVVLKSDEIHTLFTRKRSWVVQSFPEGERVVVFATRMKALAILRNPDQGEIAPEALKAAAQLAVDAVRATPELRWAAVDIAVTGMRVTSSRGDPHQVLVEGLVVNKELTGSEKIIAGSMDHIYQFVLSSEV